MDEPNQHAHSSLATLMTVMGWLTLLGLLVAYFLFDEERRFNPNQTPESYRQGEEKRLVLQANANNHFVMTGKLNGKSSTLFLDTGATHVAIPAKLADRLGLVRGRRGYSNTANGVIETFATTIDTIELGEIVLHDVAAQISPAMNNMDEILLGMSALSKIEFTQKQGTLTLIQR